jgi:hypothetical protein
MTTETFESRLGVRYLNNDIQISAIMTVKLTSSTMFDPPEELHGRFEAALEGLRAGLGVTHRMYVADQDQSATQT